jgi:hypothetical protein
LLLLLSKFQHFRVVRIDFTETCCDVIPVAALSQRRESFGQSHQETPSAIIDRFLEKFVDLRGAFPPSFQGRFHQSHHFVSVRMATDDGRWNVGGRGCHGVDRHRTGLLVLMVWLQLMLLLLRPIQFAQEVGV